MTRSLILLTVNQQQGNQEQLDDFRRSMNAATVDLANSQLLDEEGTLALVRVLHTYGRVIHESMQEQQEHRSDVLHNRDLEEASHEENAALFQTQQGLHDKTEDAVPARPLYLEENPCQQVNPIVFAHPFLVAPLQRTSTAGDEMMRDRFTSLCAIAVYNLGLARHTQSLVPNLDDSKREDLLEEATEFYRRAYDLLDHLSSLSPDDTLFLVYLAVCVNMAEACQVLGNAEEAASWQAVLHTCLPSVTPVPHSPIYRHFINARDSFGISFL